MTLLEITLVLVLLVLIAAIAWPTLQTSLAGLELDGAAETFRRDLYRARLDAITAGTIYAMRCQKAGAGYVVQPWEAMTPEAPATQTGGAEDETLTRQGRLPDGISFLGFDATGAAEPLPQQAGETSVESRTGDPVIWSAPILFHPDGTTTDAQVVLHNESGQCISVQLRGLTGTATISDVLSYEELLP